MSKETAVQRAERLKREQNPWEELPRLLAALRGGVDGMQPEDVNTRLRWWGLYTQGDGEGAFGGATRYFMLRVRVPGGRLTPAQTQVLAGLTRHYARGVADVTVRQNLQLHWLEAEVIPEIFATLVAAGLTSQSACGDDPRNLTGCPVAGLDPEEWTDASPLLAETNRQLLATGDFYNLPRKFKVCITGCRDWCSHPEINDAAFTAHRRGSKLGFALRVGGGLSSTPALARALPVWIAPEMVPRVAVAIASLFRDCDELRQNRAKARLKFLFLEYGWTVDRFRAELERRLGTQLPDGEPDTPPEPEFRDHMGWHAEKTPGLWYAGVNVPRGRISADQLEAVAEAAAGGSVRATAMQNLVIAGIPERSKAQAQASLGATGLKLWASAFERGAVACTGKEFCKLAVAETKTFTAALVDDLERRLPQFSELIQINVNGCPNSCGQHWTADIGLQGVRVKTPQGPRDGFDIFLGGGLGRDPRFARRTLGRVVDLEIAARLEALLRVFLAQRSGGELFRQWVERVGVEPLGRILGTAPLAAMPERQRGDFVPLAEVG